MATYPEETPAMSTTTDRQHEPTWGETQKAWDPDIDGQGNEGLAAAADRLEAANRAAAELDLIGWWHLSPSIDGERWDLVVSFATGAQEAATDGRAPAPTSGTHGPLRLNAARLSLSGARRASLRKGLASATQTIASYGWFAVLGETDPRRKAATGSIRGKRST